MKGRINENFVSPITKEKLRQNKGKLIDESTNEFKIVSGIPILIPKEYMADCHRELIEILLWQYPDEVEKIYSEKDWNENPIGVYTRYINRLLKDKKGILKSFETYEKQDTAKWIIPVKSKSITLRQRIKFFKYSNKSTGEKRTETKINPRGNFLPYSYFGKLVSENNPKTIVELGMGAGGGTAAAGLNMREDAKLYPVDIDFECLGNAIGIRKYQEKNIIPVCANFWFLPFSDNSADSVFTYNGLDESRETEKTVKEVSRILKENGIFTVSSRKNSFMRQGAILEQFGFDENEVIELMKRCRAYSSIEDLYKICGDNNLELISSKQFKISDERIQVISQFKKRTAHWLQEK